MILRKLELKINIFEDGEITFEKIDPETPMDDSAGTAYRESLDGFGQLFEELVRRVDDGEYDSKHGPFVNGFVREQLVSIIEFWMIEKALRAAAEFSIRKTEAVPWPIMAEVHP